MPYRDNIDLPEPLYNILTNDDYLYEEDVWSITTLVAPPQIVQLQRRHEDKTPKDPLDNTFILFGKAIHALLEREALLNDGNYHKRYIIEERYYDTLDGVQISGQIDLYDIQTKTLWDFKVTSFWVEQFGIHDEWKSQLNCYKRFLENEDYKVDHLKIATIIRDVKRDANRIIIAPKKQINVFDVPIWSVAQTENYLKERIKLHTLNKSLLDDQLTPCTPDERWIKSKWAVINTKNLQSKAELFEEEIEALEKKEQLGEGYIVSNRSSTPIRCLEFCEAREICNQLKKEGWKFKNGKVLKKKV